MAAEQTFAGMGHPYYPPYADITNYTPNATPLPVLLASFGLIIVIVLTAAWVLARQAESRFRDASFFDQVQFLWFALCGSLHCLFEGYFVLNHATLAASQSLPAQLWKEYALSDSRYLTSDPFTLSVETVTVCVLGPICWLTAISIVRDRDNAKNSKPSSGLRYPLQMLVSMAHLYGVSLYYGTVAAEVFLRDVSYYRPEFIYFWVYFLGMNAPWVIMPAAILHSSFSQIRRAFAALSKMDSALQASSRLHGRAEPKKTR